MNNHNDHNDNQELTVAVGRVSGWLCARAQARSPARLFKRRQEALGGLRQRPAFNKIDLEKRAQPLGDSNFQRAC